MRRASSGRRAPQLALLCALAACTPIPKEIPPELLDCAPTQETPVKPIAWAPLAWAKEPTPQCLAREQVSDYQREVRERLYARWTIPSASSPGSRVELRFSLAADGKIVGACLLRTDDAALGKSAVQALFRAAPFPAMSEAARCLAGRRLVGTFSVQR